MANSSPCLPYLSHLSNTGSRSYVIFAVILGNLPTHAFLSPFTSGSIQLFISWSGVRSFLLNPSLAAPGPIVTTSLSAKLLSKLHSQDVIYHMTPSLSWALMTSWPLCHRYINHTRGRRIMIAENLLKTISLTPRQKQPPSATCIYLPATVKHLEGHGMITLSSQC